MKILKSVLFTIFLVMAFFAANAQSAVYFDRNNGAVGYAYGNTNCNNDAYDACINYGGRNPVRVLYVNSKGYGAIAIGYNAYGSRVIGAAAGYSSAYEAQQYAIRGAVANGALRAVIHASWLDY